MSWLKGKRSYIVAGIGVLVNGLFAMGYIPQEYVPTVNIILGFLGLAALRAAVSK